MNPDQIKIYLFRKLELLNENQLEEAYGVLLNFINSRNGTDDWKYLSTEQQDAIRLGIEQLDKGEGRQHGDVISAFRNKFLNE